MPKSNFLLVDLNEPKTKKLAETITSTTSRKILNHLTEKDDSEANIAKALHLPISTVHYHLHKLQKASLVLVEEFHYSPKGREVNHYKLANKYIIIAPQKVTGMRTMLKQKLKGILPVGIIALGISVIIKFLSSFTKMTAASYQAATKVAERTLTAEKAAIITEEMADAAPTAAEKVGEAVPLIADKPDVALWFLIGSIATIVVYLIVEIVRERFRK